MPELSVRNSRRDGMSSVQRWFEYNPQPHLPKHLYENLQKQNEFNKFRIYPQTDDAASTQLPLVIVFTHVAVHKMDIATHLLINSNLNIFYETKSCT